MMSRYWLLSAAVLALAGLCLAVVPSHAQAPAGLKIGVVNADRLFQEYPVTAEKQKELEAMRRSAVELLQSLTQYTFLPAETFAEVVGILRLPRPLPKDKQDRLDALLKLSTDKDQEFRNLRAKTGRTPEEEDKFRTLQDLVEARQQDLQALEQQLVDEILARQQEYKTQLLAQVREAITAVAREKGYDLVLDSFGVLYGGEDITDAVLAVLKKGLPPSPAAPPAPAPQPPGGESGGGQGGQ